MRYRADCGGDTHVAKKGKGKAMIRHTAVDRETTGSRRRRAWSCRLLALSLISIVAALPAAGAAQSGGADSATAAAPLFDAVVACRTIADPTERLACFDRAVPALDQARRDRQIVVMDREQVRETRRGLFGLNLPAIRIFGGGDDDDSPDSEAVDRLETTVARASQSADGKWTIVLADGARWQQLDTRRINDPRPGTAVVIRRAAMGSYLANVGGQVAIRVRRVN